MSNLHVKYLLIGAGAASSAAAEAIRARDKEGAVLMIGQEINRPYGRSALGRQFLRHESSRGDLFTHTPQWFAEQNIQLQTGRRAVQLDTMRFSVTLDSGQDISYDQLLLATGATARQLDVPGAALPNTFYVRTVEDAERLQLAVEKAKREGRPQPADQTRRGCATVIGSGLLAIELAASLAQLGLSVDLVVAEAHPWESIAGEATGRFLARFLERHGVRVHLGHRAQRLEGDGRVQRAVLDSGDIIPCDFAVAAIGKQPNKDLLRGTPISAEKAVLVDEQCRTNVPNVCAAGDCAAMFDPLFGKHRLARHWDTAASTGALAGANMAGAGERYSAVSDFTTEIFGLPIFGWGLAKIVDRRLLRGTPNVEAPDFVEIGVAADGRIAEVLAVGHRSQHDLLRQLVQRRVQVDGNEEGLKDPKSDLGRFLL